ncbi:MAG: NAD-dependent epimerase/dehydratase family protein [Candidatus Hodarchaeota archaeon]
MTRALFITGSSGFIANYLLQRIDLRRYRNIYCLSRTDSQITTRLSAYDNFKFIKGSIYEVNTYRPYLASSDIVVHLAAVTGKARPEEYFNVNAKGTEFLTRQCEKLGVYKFLYISSIAVKFNDISKYYYAQSKQQGEDAVRNSNLNYTIVRPTIVIGKESPIWKGFSKLAKAPITPIFGDGTTRIQPIYIEDLINCILSIINENIFLNETHDLGGPEEITIENFLERIHQIYYKKDPRIIHLPLRLLIFILSVIEKRFYSVLPFTVGQLSSFLCDGTIEENILFLRFLPQMKNVDEMLRRIISNG